jgi:hypothetical protein
MAYYHAIYLEELRRTTKSSVKTDNSRNTKRAPFKFMSRALPLAQLLRFTSDILVVWRNYNTEIIRLDLFFIYNINILIPCILLNCKFEYTEYETKRPLRYDVGWQLSV